MKLTSKNIGIDLGTANVMVYVQGEGIIINEPSIVAMDRNTGKTIAIGKEAKNMVGKTPHKIQTIKPLKDGVIADFDSAEAMLNHFIKKSESKGFLSRPTIVICCPTNITTVEKNAIKEVAEKCGAKKVFIEEEPKVAAIGSGMNISAPHGSMVVDIGGGTTDIAVLSLGDIVTSASIKIAGNKFDQDIIDYVKIKYKLLIGEKTAEELKMNISSALPISSSPKKYLAKGRDLVTGLPKNIELNENDIFTAIQNSIDVLTKKIKEVLETSEPELSADIFEKGIVLTGGGALMKNLDNHLKNELKIPVFVAERPLDCVALGTGILLENI